MSGGGGGDERSVKPSRIIAINFLLLQNVASHNVNIT